MTKKELAKQVRKWPNERLTPAWRAAHAQRAEAQKLMDVIQSESDRRQRAGTY
jgi:hypothetical protein